MKSAFEKVLIEYKEIKASDLLKEKVKKTMKRDQRNRIIKRATAACVCLLLMGVVTANINSNFAYAMSEIPGLKGIVKVITFSKYEFSDNGYEAKVVTPKIEGLLDKELEAKLNTEFKQNAESVISAFEKDVNELKQNFGEETVHMGIESNYIVKTDNDKILALDLYTFSVAGSSSTVHSFYTIDKKSGQILTLKGLFEEDADYTAVISAYIKKEMIRLNEKEDGMFWVNSEIPDWDFQKIKADQNFYINNEGQLVICFDKYEIAAGAQGSPEFVIPKEIIEDITK